MNPTLNTTVGSACPVDVSLNAEQQSGILCQVRVIFLLASSIIYVSQDFQSLDHKRHNGSLRDFACSCIKGLSTHMHF